MFKWIYKFLVPHFEVMYFGATVLQWSEGYPIELGKLWAMDANYNSMDSGMVPDIVIKSSVFTWIGLVFTGIDTHNLDYMTYTEWSENFG